MDPSEFMGLFYTNLPTSTARPGQFFFNLLYEKYPDLANEIRGTDLDPFHQDKVLPQTIEWLFSRMC